MSLLATKGQNIINCSKGSICHKLLQRVKMPLVATMGQYIISYYNGSICH